jgi:hypothetical protein
MGDFIGDGLNLPRIRAAADHESISEARHALQVEYADILSLFGFGGVDGGEPEGLGFLQLLRPSQENNAPVCILLQRGRCVCR